MRRRPGPSAARRWWARPSSALVLLLALAAAFAACGRGSAQPDPHRLRRPSEFVLRPAEVPGLPPSDAAAVSNDDAASSSPDPRAARADFRKWRRLDGYRVTFSDDGPAPNGWLLVESDIALFQEPGGAHDAFVAGVRDLRRAGMPGAPAQWTELPSPKLGDEAVARQTSGRAADGTTTTAVAVVWRRGRGLALVAISATEGRITLDQVVELAQRVDRRMEGSDRG